MRIVTLSILAVAAAHTMNMAANSTSDAKAVMDTLAEKLVGKVVRQSSPLHDTTDLDCTLLGKSGHLAVPLRTAIIQPRASALTVAGHRSQLCHHGSSTRLLLRAHALVGGAIDSTSQQPSLPLSQMKIREGKFTWAKIGVDIHYLRAAGPPQTHVLASNESSIRGRKPPVLFLPGFGVGSFQFIRNLEKAARDRDAYSFDWLGQGRSWPSEDGLDGLQISADTWVEQAHAFITEVIGEPVYVAGNSLGGFLATQLAAKHPEDVRGVVLLNASPFWAFRDGKQFPGNLLWDGKLPTPWFYKGISTLAFDSLRNEATVKSILDFVYADCKAVTQKLVKDIVNAASHPVGPDAYASIVFSPKPDTSFADALQTSATYGIKFLMMYGRDDPWIVPMWGKRAYLNLWKAASYSAKSIDDVVRYLEITPAGHCPHDEAPETIAQTSEAWFQSLEHVESKQGTHNTMALNFEHPKQIQEESGRMIHVEDVGGQDARNLGEWVGTLGMRSRVAQPSEGQR